MNWERLLGGLPDGQRALFSALTIEVWPGGYGLHAVDNRQAFESLDGGDHWTIIADVPPVSKGEFHRGLVRRPRQARDRGRYRGERPCGQALGCG